jgi:hypothetical protein
MYIKMKQRYQATRDTLTKENANLMKELAIQKENAVELTMEMIDWKKKAKMLEEKPKDCEEKAPEKCSAYSSSGIGVRSSVTSSSKTNKRTETSITKTNKEKGAEKTNKLNLVVRNKLDHWPTIFDTSNDGKATKPKVYCLIQLYLLNTILFNNRRSIIHLYSKIVSVHYQY